MTPSPAPQPDPSAWQTARLSPGRRRQRRAAALSVLAGLIWPLQAAVVAWAIGHLLSGTSASAVIAAIAFGGLGIFRAALGCLAEAQAQAAAEAIIVEARHAIVAAEARRAGDSRFGGAGSVAALAGEKLEMLGPYVARYAPARARVMVLPGVILALATWQSWAVGVVLLISGPLIPVFMALVGMAAKEASARQMTQIGTLNDFLVERLSALVDIRLLGAGTAVLGGFQRQAGDLRRRTMAVLGVAFLSSTVLELFAAIGVAIVAVYVGFSLLGALGFGAWGGPLTPEAGIFLLLLAPEFYQPLRDLSAAWHDKAAASAVRNELAAYGAEDGVGLPGTGGPAARLAGPASLHLRGCVTPSGRPLPDIVIGAGERVARVGASGTGKTSALRLMAGLELPQQGRVLVAGQALTGETADAWRARLGWMPQAPHFPAGSLRQNLTLGRAGDLTGALASAAIGAVVRALPQGLSTRLGETGAGLSGGEALASAGRTMQLAYLGARTGARAPDVFQAVVADRDFDRTGLKPLSIRLLISKSELSDLQQALQIIVEKAEENVIDPDKFFAQVLGAAADMSRRPDRISQRGGDTLAEVATINAYIEDLPYTSRIMSVTEDDWIRMSISEQQTIVNELHEKIERHRRYNEATDAWVDVLGQGSGADALVYPIRLDDLP